MDIEIKAQSNTLKKDYPLVHTKNVEGDLCVCHLITSKETLTLVYAVAAIRDFRFPDLGLEYYALLVFEIVAVHLITRSWNLESVWM
jgi:hypothetical protein